LYENFIHETEYAFLYISRIPETTINYLESCSPLFHKTAEVVAKMPMQNKNANQQQESVYIIHADAFFNAVTSQEYWRGYTGAALVTTKICDINYE
jgi:hypothetical protein